jgi:hypothetical protein
MKLKESKPTTTRESAWVCNKCNVQHGISKITSSPHNHKRKEMERYNQLERKLQMLKEVWLEPLHNDNFNEKAR